MNDKFKMSNDCMMSVSISFVKTDWHENENLYCYQKQFHPIVCYKMYRAKFQLVHWKPSKHSVVNSMPILLSSQLVLQLA